MTLVGAVDVNGDRELVRVGLYGADVAELRRLAGSFRLQATQLGPAVGLIDHRLATTCWSGADRDEFAHRWVSQLRPALLAAIRSLDGAGDVAESNADAQDTASAATGAGAPAVTAAVGGAGAPAVTAAVGGAGAMPALASARPSNEDDPVPWPDPNELFSGPPTVADAEEEAAALAAGYRDGTVSGAALLEFITAHPDDAGALGVLFAGLGGRGTLALMLSFWNMHTHDEQAISQIRDALATGSATWDDATARDFADGLLPGPDNRGLPHGYAPLVEYLFSGPNPLSGNLAAATATILEDLPGLGVTGNGVDQLDLTRAVLLTLAHYPEATTAYFADPEHGLDRRLQWFTNTDWTAQGFDVPAALLNATQLTADGQPIATAGSAAEQRAAAVLFSQLVRDLTRNPDFYPENINDEAGRQLAQAIGTNWAAIQDAWQTTGYKDATTRTDGETYAALIDTLSGGDAYAPVIPREHLEWLLGVAGSTPSGAAVLDGTMTAYRNQLLDYGQHGEGDVNGKLPGITDRLIRAQEMLDRAVNTQALETAMRSDAATRGAIADSLVVVGAALSPFTGGGSTVAGQVGAFVANSVVTTLVNDGLGNWLAHDAADAEARLGTDTGRQDQLARMTTSAIIAEIIGVKVDPLPRPEDYPTKPEPQYYMKGPGYSIPVYTEPIDPGARYAEAAEEWNERNYDAVIEVAKDPNLAGVNLDNLVSRYDSTPYVTGKKPS